MDALDLLASNNYITVNKTLIKEIGLENAIIFGLLCGYQRGYGSEEFYKEQEKIIEDSCLSEYLVRKSIKELKEMKYIFVEKKGMPAKYYYKINLDLLSFKLEKSSGVKSDTTGGLEFKAQNKNNNKNNIEESIINNTKEIFDYWNEKKIQVHRDIKSFETKIKSALKEHSVEEIKLAIDHYKEILDDSNYFYKYKWTLNDFLGRGKGYEEFLENGNKWENYKSFKEKQKSYNPYKREEISRETKYPELDDIGYYR